MDLALIIPGLALVGFVLYILLGHDRWWWILDASEVSVVERVQLGNSSYRTEGPGKLVVIFPFIEKEVERMDIVKEAREFRGVFLTRDNLEVNQEVKSFDQIVDPLLWYMTKEKVRVATCFGEPNMEVADVIKSHTLDTLKNLRIREINTPDGMQERFLSIGRKHLGIQLGPLVLPTELMDEFAKDAQASAEATRVKKIGSAMQEHGGNADHILGVIRADVDSQFAQARNKRMIVNIGGTKPMAKAINQQAAVKLLQEGDDEQQQ